MAENTVQNTNGGGAASQQVKKSTRKTAKKVEELKMEKSQTAGEMTDKVEATVDDAVSDVNQTADKVADQVKDAAGDAADAADKAADQVKDAAGDIQESASKAVEDTQLPSNGHDADSGIKKVVKDASAQVDKLPGTKQVKDAVSKAADQFGSADVTQKAVRRVRDAADSVKHSAQDLDKNPLVVAAHKVLLAGIGAAALAQEEIEDFVNRLVERGSIAESDGKRMVKDVLDQRRKQMERAGERAQEVAGDLTTKLTEEPRKIADDLEQRIEGVLTRMNIPTKDEIETLTSKITALTRKVDNLKKPE